jgi:exodeoxyribonuclease VII large subunit
LLDLNRQVKEILKEHTERNYWVVAEISELKTNYSGHCYLELVQKDKDSERVVARSRATIWAPHYRMIKPYFETTTGQTLAEGLSVLVRVNIEFHELFGLSLNITDIEPNYTIGELAVLKQKIIDRLTSEGVIGMNRDLELEVPCRKIAIISSATAAGYGDFCDQLVNNAYGYKFYLKLFPAMMQGNEAEQSIIAALDKIYAHDSFFDAVVIIRGGGSQTDLNCFNSYWLAYHVTQFPLPVLTGIGHEQDDSVTDLVAHKRLKTPTAAAAFLIDLMAQHDEILTDTASQIFSLARDQMNQLQNDLGTLSANILAVTKNSVIGRIRLVERFAYQLSRLSSAVFGREHAGLALTKIKMHNRIANILKSRNYQLQVGNKLIRNSARHCISDYRLKISDYSSQIRHLDPVNILARGYSITHIQGKVLRNASGVKKDDLIETVLFKGTIISSVIKN